MGQKFQISAIRQGAAAQVRIIGEIGWDTDSETFRVQCDELIAQGVRDVAVYINTPGGSCFDAAEIVHILSRFAGTVTGEGGALVASAGTYIAAHCKTFSMPANGQFMVHKPSGGTRGKADDIAAYLKLMQDIETEYFKTYNGLVKDKAGFAAKWQAGDYWMTAEEAREAGFITDVKEKVQIDRQTAMMIAACGCPSAPVITNNFNNQMDIKKTAIALGMDENASEEQVSARLAENRRKADELEALKAENEAREKREREAKIKAALDKAQQEKRINAETRPKWEKLLNEHFEPAIDALESVPAVVPLSKQIGKTATAGDRTTCEGKTFEELQESDPDSLARLEENDPEAFGELFADWKKRNKIS
ncbi:MAG: ATP-dependent Clp protease proteolytic subunit [Bacteroidales bacterium]|jgi:ATP-dependent protease ClpP protease subunit|nr:ATP-dependent Clp protease proteolytic subunit [Bacteroidales bacterium]